MLCCVAVPNKPRFQFLCCEFLPDTLKANTSRISSMTRGKRYQINFKFLNLNCKVFEAGKLPIAAPPPLCSDWLIESKCSAATAQEFAAWTSIFQRRAKVGRRGPGGHDFWLLAGAGIFHLKYGTVSGKKQSLFLVTRDFRIKKKPKILCHLQTVKVTGGVRGEIF